MGRKKEIDDRFKAFGIVSFTATTKVNDFIDYLKNGRVMATLCKNCETSFFPPRADCCKCLSSEMEWIEIKGPGRLVTFSRLEFAPIGFEKELPYSIALVDFGRVKVFGRLAPELTENEVKIGMLFNPRVRSIGEEKYTYLFEKA